ncbi:L-type lectin-domain containing receptor kinase IX.1-like [Tripterygium wilfordii]|uniref:L-type lectin-domain containing receptor kinase IX.1-like n=1 Tax=Tripterygium wilfordii TaxID=458696 RepID=UPI0018F8047F|nr:L-type lectin-domain containing receptor kinase IX.1-like [Tripterygium wilfordii]
MVVCNFTTSCFLLSHLSMIFIVLALVIPFASSLSFNFTSFDTNDKNITYERSASPSNNAIQMTLNLNGEATTERHGRATYYEPMHLWDKASGNLADFTTHFSFVIDSQFRTLYGDGIAFFLAPPGSRIPDNATRGGTLALTNDGDELNFTRNSFVAVEFDAFSNFFDPPGEHVGIDINSLKSVSNVTWYCNITGGKMNDAWITYNSSTKNLSVVFTGFRKNTKFKQQLYHVVDLSDYLPEWVTFGFSAATGAATAIHTVNSWEFSSTLQIDTSPPTSAHPTSAPPTPSPQTSAPPTSAPPTPSPQCCRRRKNKTWLGVGLGVGGSLLVVGLVFVWFAATPRQRNADEDQDDHVLHDFIKDEHDSGRGPKKFSYDELAHATNNFNEEAKLGEGGFGGVYKGFLGDLNSYVAVKRISSGSKQGVKEFAAEVNIISRLRHRNLVKLIGWCHERKELLLVYEYMPKGSLYSHLFQENSSLTWKVRYKIARGLALGLLYLHEELDQCVVHRDIKSSNIMLDSNFNAKLGDFGLARLVDHEKGSQTTILAGTMGYMAPECATTGKASRETDVYSFGIVALEISCGRKPINRMAVEAETHLVSWVWELYGCGKLLEAADRTLSGEFDEQQMQRLMIVGLGCAHPDENLRLSIRQAINVLNFEGPLPVLPSKMPVPTYLAPPVNAASVLLPYAATYSEGGGYQSSSVGYNTGSSQGTSSIELASSTVSLLHTR